MIIARRISKISGPLKNPGPVSKVPPGPPLNAPVHKMSFKFHSLILYFLLSQQIADTLRLVKQIAYFHVHGPDRFDVITSQGRNQGFVKGGLKMEKFCDVILMTYFRWRSLMMSYLIFLKLYYIIINLKDHKLAKSSNFGTPGHKK